MDKKSLMAIALITVVILVLPYYYNLIYDEPVYQETEEPIIKKKSIEEPIVTEKEVTFRPGQTKTPEIIRVEKEETPEIPKGNTTEATEIYYTEIKTP